LDDRVKEGALAEATRHVARLVWSPHGCHRDTDTLVEEEPLEIRLAGVPIAVVMRTPGHDFELGMGFAVTEAIVQSASDLARVQHCSTGSHADNVLLLTPREGLDIDPTRIARSLFSSSSCGICGKRTIEQALAKAPPISEPVRVAPSLLAELPQKLKELQPTFMLTGGLHAAGLFDAAGRLLCVREDIGRHNAVDKVVGWALRTGVPLPACGLVVSGRASYEVVQKALAARISLVLAVGAVSSLAAELAHTASMTLIGFARSDKLSVYGGGPALGL
jgi:FdhD protein